MSYGLHDALRDVIVDLRDTTALTSRLADPAAIDEGWPADEQEFPAVVRVQPITATSDASHEHATVERTFRLQFSLVVTQGWRDDHQAPTYRMAELMNHVADRLDVAADAPELQPEGGDGGSFQEVTGDRVALIQDWRVTTYTR